MGSRSRHLLVRHVHGYLARLVLQIGSAVFGGHPRQKILERIFRATLLGDDRAALKMIADFIDSAPYCDDNKYLQHLLSDTIHGRAEVLTWEDVTAAASTSQVARFHSGRLTIKYRLERSEVEPRGCLVRS